MEKSFSYDKSKLVAEIQSILNSWINEEKNRSVAELSRRTPVSDTTIRRLMNNGSMIGDEAVYELLAHVVGSREYADILNILEEKVEAKKWFQKEFAYKLLTPNMQNYRPTTNQANIVLNPISFSVFALVSSIPNVDAKYIRDQFGVRGEIELEGLIERGVLDTDGECFKVIGSDKVRIDKHTAIALLPEITRTYLKADSKHNYRALEVEGVSKDGYGDLMELFAKFLNDAHAIFKDKPGTIPVVVAGYVDTFTTQPYFEGGKNETPN